MIKLNSAKTSSKHNKPAERDFLSGICLSRSAFFFKEYPMAKQKPGKKQLPKTSDRKLAYVAKRLTAVFMKGVK